MKFNRDVAEMKFVIFNKDNNRFAREGVHDEERPGNERTDNHR